MLFDTRWQTLKAEKGGSPMSKTWGFFLVDQDMVLSHRVKVQLIHFFWVEAISTRLYSFECYFAFSAKLALILPLTLILTLTQTLTEAK